MERRSLTDRQKAALTALWQEKNGSPKVEFLHPGRVAVLCGDRRPFAGHGWRNTLQALERLGLVRVTYQLTHGGAGMFAITDEGERVLRG